MKKYIIMTCIAVPLNGMHMQIQKAIEHSDLQKVEVLLHSLKNQPAHEASSLLGTRQKIDLDQLHSCAQKLLQETGNTKDTRHNVHFYKRVSLGIATFSTGLLTAAYYFYQSATTHQPGSYGEFLSILLATGGLMGHGIENIRLGIGNHDANTLYAKHLAINHLISNARQESVHETSL